MALPRNTSSGAADIVPRLIRVRLVQNPYLAYQNDAEKVNNLKIINPEIVDGRGKERKTNIEDTWLWSGATTSP